MEGSKLPFYFSLFISLSILLLNSAFSLVSDQKAIDDLSVSG